jgi:hypothetical protein
MYLAGITIEEIMVENDAKNSPPTQIGIHSVRNILGSPSQLTLFSDQHTKFADEYGLEVAGKIEGFGIDLTDIQMRVMEGILRGFTETNYKGNVAPEDKDNIAQQKYSGKLPDTYKHIQEVPRLRITQKRLIELAGLNPGSIGDRERTVDAILVLGEKQFCFCYDRLALNENNQPEKDKSGNWKKEEVSYVDSLFTIKMVREEVSGTHLSKGPKLPGNVKYYEITPSGIFLDQVESYFMLIPNGWRDEIQALLGKKKTSARTFKFFLFLRWQYEMKRRSKSQEKPYQIRWSPEDIAIALKIPESVYKGQKERTNKILEESYELAKKLGYLIDYERTGTVDVLTLKDEKYAATSNPVLEKAIGEMGRSNSSTLACLFELFHKKKKELNHCHKPPRGEEKELQFKELDRLLDQRKPQEIEELISWGLSLKYWCTRLSTPAKLKDHFDEAWTEMNAQKRQPKASQIVEENKRIGIALQNMLSARRKDIEIEILSTHMEVRQTNGPVACLEYTADFRKKIEMFLHHIQIPLDEFANHIKSSL